MLSPNITGLINFFTCLQSEKVVQVVSKLDQLSNMNKKQDLLDMELEEAETRYGCRQLLTHAFSTLDLPLLFRVCVLN